MLYYLKVNREEGYSIRSLKHWINIVKCDDNGKYVIICDKDSLKERIIKEIEGTSSDDFISSNRTESRLIEITKNNTSDFWNNASYSHLTTFLDAEERKITEFWNIDADDTLFCVSEDRVVDILHKAREYAKENGIHAFSFDMSRSRRNGKFWTFGVTYTDNSVDWFKGMMDHCYEKYYENAGYSALKLPECIDTYFSYLDTVTQLNMGTFYVENCKFVHYSNDFVYRPWCSWFATYKDGKIIKPMLRDFYELESIGVVDIYEDVVKLDIGLTTEEQVDWLINRAAENDNNKNIMRKSAEKRKLNE